MSLLTRWRKRREWRDGPSLTIAEVNAVMQPWWDRELERERQRMRTQMLAPNVLVARLLANDEYDQHDHEDQKK